MENGNFFKISQLLVHKVMILILENCSNRMIVICHYKLSLTMSQELTNSIMPHWRLRKPLWTTIELIIIGITLMLRDTLLWTMLDDFEWIFGYTLRFGVHYVNFKDGLKKYPNSQPTDSRISLRNTSHDGARILK